MADQEQDQIALVQSVMNAQSSQLEKDLRSLDSTMDEMERDIATSRGLPQRDRQRLVGVMEESTAKFEAIFDGFGNIVEAAEGMQSSARKRITRARRLIQRMSGSTPNRR